MFYKKIHIHKLDVSLNIPLSFCQAAEMNKVMWVDC